MPIPESTRDDELDAGLWDDPDDRSLYVNGVDGATGNYLVPPLDPQAVVAVARAALRSPAQAAGMTAPRHSGRPRFRGVRRRIDPTKLESAGWGVIIAESVTPDMREALAPLLAHRRAQASMLHTHRYREFVGADGYRQGETRYDFLARHGAGPGPADPDHVPYYLLIVGGPESIPYSFQYELDTTYAVGRIHFETAEEYARYAATVIAAETGRAGRAARAVFLGTRNPGDRATQRSATRLVTPLAAAFAETHPDWSVRAVLAHEATKPSFAAVLGGADTPALLFTASHGIGFAEEHPLQRRHQGALICQEWQPFRGSGPVPAEQYFAAEDVADDANVAGMIAFHFACYSAGTPLLDEFSRHIERREVRLASAPFVAALPARLLGHPRGGALAVVGHVDRAWGCSFSWPGVEEHTATFEDMLATVAAGEPVGHAMACFNARWADITTALSGEIERPAPGDEASARDARLLQLWLAANDARNYMIVGDPAVRLVTESGV